MSSNEKVIKALEKCAGNGKCTKCQYGKEKQALSCKKLLKDALELLKEQEDAVRCKDCKKRGLDDCPVYGWMPDKAFGDWYCADGKRRDDDD